MVNDASLPGSTPQDPGAPPYHILIVEDDSTLAQLIIENLRRYGYMATRVTDYDDVRSQVDRIKPNLVLLDVNLPKYDGFYWCRAIRHDSPVPIIFVSGRSGPMDQVLALEGGADDYVIKPFHSEVLLAKISSLLHRTYGHYALSEPTMILHPTAQSAAQCFGLTLDGLRLTVRTAEQSEVLTAMEFRLLHALLARDGQIVARSTLLAELWDDARFVDDNTLSVNISRVRKRLARLEAAVEIETVRALGYRTIERARSQ